MVRLLQEDFDFRLCNVALPAAIEALGQPCQHFAVFFLVQHGSPHQPEKNWHPVLNWELQKLHSTGVRVVWSKMFWSYWLSDAIPSYVECTSKVEPIQLGSYWAQYSPTFSQSSTDNFMYITPWGFTRLWLLASFWASHLCYCWGSRNGNQGYFQREMMDPSRLFVSRAQNSCRLM